MMNKKVTIVLLMTALLTLFVTALPASAQDETDEEEITIYEVTTTEVTTTDENVPRGGGASNVYYVSYTVTHDDAKFGLSGIAKTFCTTWREIYNINQATIGPNPNIITAGMVLTVPDGCHTVIPDTGSGIIGPYTYYRYDRGVRTYATGTLWNNVYTTAQEDRLGHIAQRFGVPMVEIQKANGIINPNNINIAQQILLPGIGGSLPLGDSIRYFGSQQCAITPMLSMPLFAYPDSPVVGHSTINVAQYALQAVRTSAGAIWYRLPGDQGTGNASVWIRSFDISIFTGDCGI